MPSSPDAATPPHLAADDENLVSTAKSLGICIELTPCHTGEANFTIRERPRVQEEIRKARHDREILAQGQRQWRVSQWITVGVALMLSAPSAYFSWDSANSAKRSADAAESSLRSAAADRESSEVLAQQNADIAKRAMAAAETSASASEQSSRTARSALVVAQRAYVTVQEIRIQPDLLTGAVVEYVIRNTGRTPARNVVAKVRGVFGDIPRNMSPPVEHNFRATVSVTVLGSGDAMLSRVGIPRLSTQELAAVKSEKAMVYTYGDIEYSDEFGITRRTEACAVYDPLEAKFARCAHHNDLR